GQLVEDLVRRTRKALRRISWGSEEEWNSEKNVYRYEDEAPEFSRFFQDLYQLAVTGYLNYDVIANQLFGGSGEADRLAPLMRRPGLLQLALRESARLVLPIALLYDYPFETRLQIERVQLCPEFKRSWSASTPLTEQACFRGNCPSYGNDEVICPS